MEAIDLRTLAVHADVIVEAIVAEPARVDVMRAGATGCPDHAVGVYLLDVLDVRKAPAGVVVPARIEAFDPGDLRLAAIAEASCLGAPITPAPIAEYPTKLTWGPDKEVVVLLSYTGETWRLAAEGSWDPINRADKVTRLAGIKPD